MQTSKFSLKLSTRDWYGLLLCVLLSMLIFAPITYRRIALPVDCDYAQHVVAAQEWLDSGHLEPGFLSHPLLQILLIAMHKLSFGKLGLYASLMVLQLLVQGAISAILFLWFPAPSTSKGHFWRSFLAISLPLLAPFMLLAFQDGFFYYGYIGLANYHNPTIHLLKPFALLALILALRAFDGKKNSPLFYILSATFIILSAMVKPNFLLVFIPALCLVAAIKFLQKKPLDIPYILFGFLLPALAILTAQWYIAYASGESGSAIIIAPFQVEAAFSKNLLPKFLLSSLFVLQSTFILRREFPRDESLQLGALVFIIGLLQFYLLAEDGPRMYHGNFRWSGQIAIFLFTAVLARAGLKYFDKDPSSIRGAKISAVLAYLAQFAGGIAYYIYCMLSIHYR